MHGLRNEYLHRQRGKEDERVMHSEESGAVGMSILFWSS